MTTAPAAHPHVRLALPDGTERDLRPGDVIGRAASAALLLDDPTVSEAHAMLSLRRGRFAMLALRRLLLHRGKPSSEIALEVGAEVSLTPDLSLRVIAMSLPEHVLALEATGLGLRRIGSVASLVGGPVPAIWGRFEPSAAAHVWASGNGWRLRIGGREPVALEADDHFEVDGVLFHVRTIPLGEGTSATGGAMGTEPMRLVTFYDGVEIHRPSQPVVTIGGLGARILSELAAFGGPVPWTTVAEEVWPKEDDTGPCRHRWDMALSRLRRKLSDANVRPDLVRADGNGFFQLVLRAEDQVEDRA